MKNDRKEIADTIQKLLAKAESSGHEAEAEAFRKKAETLMEKHSLTRAELEQAEFVVEYWKPGYKRTPGWYKMIVANLGSFLGVFTGYDSTVSGKEAMFILGGREQDIEMLKYMAEAIKSQVQALTDDYKERPDVGRKEANAYRVGVVKRVGEKLQRMVDEVSDGQSEKALVLADENEKKREKGRQAANEEGHRFRSGSAATHRDRKSMRDGVRDGGKVNVNKGAPSGASDRRLTS